MEQNRTWVMELPKRKVKKRYSRDKHRNTFRSRLAERALKEGYTVACWHSKCCNLVGTRPPIELMESYATLQLGVESSYMYKADVFIIDMSEPDAVYFAYKKKMYCYSYAI